MIDVKNTKVSELRKIINEINFEEYEEYIEVFKSDGRRELEKFALRLQKKLDQYNKELQRLENIKEYENSLYDKGYKFIAGIDEVGRGPLAGPVVTAAVILPKDSKIMYMNDSKALSSQKREEIALKIKEEAISYAYGIVDNNEIDRINILNATKKAMLEAVNKLSEKPEIVLIDAVHLDTDIKQKSFIKGDANIYSISAASIIAKVYRDHMMDEYAKEYPEYGFEKNKGYGTFDHVEAIRNIGLCPIHRKTFTENIIDSRVKQGRNYENVVMNYLVKHGYSILNKNYKCKYGEIDIIVKKDDLIAFVEVKGRHKNIIAPKSYVGEEKRKRIIDSAKQYLKEKNLNEKFKIRFDVVEITDKSMGTFDVNVIEDAFRENK